MKLLFVVFMTLFLAVGCSYDDSGTSTSGDGGGGKPAEPSEWDTEIKPIIADSCALVGCHGSAAFVKTEAAFKASKSLLRISNNSMPVPGTKGAQNWSIADKEKVITFLNK